jgi:hypothetical protein
MTSLIFEYQAFNKDGNPSPESPNISVNFSVKLIILNPTQDPLPGIVDSSTPFYTDTIKVGAGFPSKDGEIGPIKVINEAPRAPTIKGNNTIRVNLSDYMNKSDIFKKFWAKWTNTIDEGYSQNNQGYFEGNSGFYYGLEITQTFKGDVNYVGFSQVDYLAVPGFFNAAAKGGEPCNQRQCFNTDFVFDDTNVNVVEVYPLVFNKTDIIDRQVTAVNSKIDFERDLENYRSQLKAQSLDLILSSAEYQPNSFTKVITRLLEFQEGTLSTSIDYAENANLLDLKDLLGTLNTEIGDLAGLYPEITIEDGEGIPYGDGIPNVYEYFGWFYDGEDRFSITTSDGSSVTDYAIITQNGVEILDTRDYESLSGKEFFTPSDYIEFPPENTQIDDVFICTVYLTQYAGSNVNFVHTNYGNEFDYINEDINITRGLNGGIYNSVVESEWDDQLSPSGTTWNSEYTDPSNFGFSDLDVVDTRTFSTFYNALDGGLGSNALNTPLIMFDETTEDYYTVQFTSWTQGKNGVSQGGGFEYTRRLITQAGVGTSFQDTLVWK